MPVCAVLVLALIHHWFVREQEQESEFVVNGGKKIVNHFKETNRTRHFSSALSHAFRNIELDDCRDEVAPSRQVWGDDVHGCPACLLFHPPQQARQTPPYDVGKVVTKSKDVLEYLGIPGQRQVQATHKEVCKSLRGKIKARKSFHTTGYNFKRALFMNLHSNTDIINLGPVYNTLKPSSCRRKLTSRRPSFFQLLTKIGFNFCGIHTITVVINYFSPNLEGPFCLPIIRDYDVPALVPALLQGGGVLLWYIIQRFCFGSGMRPCYFYLKAIAAYIERAILI